MDLPRNCAAPLTAQRAGAGLSLLTHNIGSDNKGQETGWLLAAWDKKKMKAGHSFVLPIPKRAWDHIESFRKQNSNARSIKNTNSSKPNWVFPSKKTTNVHSSPSGVYRMIYRLTAQDQLIREYKDRKKIQDGKRKNRSPQRTERIDLLAQNNIDWLSPHDIRRSVSKFLNDTTSHSNRYWYIELSHLFHRTAPYNYRFNFY